MKKIDSFDNEVPIKLVNTSKQDSFNKNNTKKKKKSYNVKTWILVFFMCCFFWIIVFSVIKIFNWNLDNKDTKKSIEKIDEIAEISEVIDDEAELVNEPEDIESDYWYYIKFPLIQVDFSELKKKNSDTVAWIQVNNTNVNYPIVQTSDNYYYLDHSYDKNYNEAGWVFMDFRNKPDFSSKNTIIYAHSRLDKTMFGSLSKVLKKDWYNNKDNHIIKISTPTENSLWQIFSVYKIEAESYYITTDFADTNSYIKFLETLKNRSKYNFNTTLNENDVIITLSTCYSDTERTVVHAKMIKKSSR